LLSTIEIENFKSIEKLKLNPKRITVLIGPNNSGKSSVLQSLAVLKQSRIQGGGLNFNGNLFRIGAYHDAVYNHDDDLNVRIGIGGTIPWNKSVPPILGIVKDIELFVSFTQSSMTLERAQGAIRLGSIPFEWDISFRRQITLPTFGVGGFVLTASVSQQVGVPTIYVSGRTSGTADELNDQLQISLQRISNALSQMWGGIVLIPPLRGQDESTLDLVPTLPEDFLDAGGHREEEMKTIGTLAMVRQLGDKISDWNERITGSKVRVTNTQNKRVTMEATKGSLTTNITNEGFGPNQLTYLLIPLAAAPNGSTVGIEEPEVHLHPQAQIALVDVLIDEAASQNKQLIMTTHSDFLLSYLLTLVASKRLAKEDLAIYSFELKDGVTTASQLAVDEHGQVEGGLPSFFKANLDLMKRYSDAVLERR